MEEETRIVASESSVPARPLAEELVAQVLQAVDVIMERMELETPNPVTAKKVRGSRTVSREFVAAMAAAVDALPELQRLGLFDSDAARQMLQGRDSMQLVADRVAMLMTRVNFTIEARWARITRAALETYRMASAMATVVDNPELAAHVEILRRHLGRTNQPKKKKPKS